MHSAAGSEGTNFPLALTGLENPPNRKMVMPEAVFVACRHSPLLALPRRSTPSVVKAKLLAKLLSRWGDHGRICIVVFPALCRRDSSAVARALSTLKDERYAIGPRQSRKDARNSKYRWRGGGDLGPARRLIKKNRPVRFPPLSIDMWDYSLDP